MQNYGKNRITEGSIWRGILYFFFPILFGTFFQQLYNTADAVVVGRFAGTAALAAVGGSTGALLNFFVNLYVGISAGTAVVVAQNFGSRDMKSLKDAVHTSISLALGGGLLLTVIGLIITPLALQLTGTPADVMPLATAYMRIVFLGSIPSFIYNMGAGILRAVGDTKRPLYFLIIASLVNIVLDVLFVAGFGMGVHGAAIATILSQFVSAGLVLLALVQPNTVYELNLRALELVPKQLAGILRVGVPAGIQSNMYAISNIILQSCVNGFGTATVAAWAADSKVGGLFWMISGAYGIAITTYAGQNFGAQKYDRVHKSTLICLGMSLGTAALFSVFYRLFGLTMMQWFTTDANVLKVGAHVIEVMFPFYLLFVCIEILSGAIRGCGDSFVPMLMTCFGVCVLRILWVFILIPQFNTLDTVMYSYPVSWGLTSLLFIAYYLHGGWLKRAKNRAGHLRAPAEAQV